MPTYEYKCNNCDYEVEIINVPMGTDYIDCPDCGALAGKKISTFAFPGSRKKWSGNKHVNFHVDTADEVYNKQIKLMANSGKKPPNVTTSQWNACLAGHKKKADNTVPITVADEHKYSIPQKAEKVYVPT